MSAATETFSTLAGLPLYYGRPPQAPYGAQGVKVRQVGPVVPSFRKSLEAGCQRVLDACPEQVLTWQVASVYRKGENSRHGEGRALDLDGVWLDGIRPIIAGNAPADAKRYLAVEACFRHEFGQILNWWYNARHHDHWHIDDRRGPGFYQTSRQCVVFVQAALHYVFGKDLLIDGVWGPGTESSAASILAGIAGAPEVLAAGWQYFLVAVSHVGFGTLEAYPP